MNLVEQAKIKDPKLRSSIIALLQEADDRELKINELVANANSKEYGSFVEELKVILGS